MGSSIQGGHLACGCSEKGRSMGWALHSSLVDQHFLCFCACACLQKATDICSRGASAWSGGASRTCTASVSEVGGGRYRWVPLTGILWSARPWLVKAGIASVCYMGQKREPGPLEICGAEQRSALHKRSASLLPLSQVVSAETLQGTLLCSECFKMLKKINS